MIFFCIMTFSVLSSFIQQSLNIIYPSHCQFCGEEMDAINAPIALCPDCWGGLKFLQTNSCIKCAQPLDSSNVTGGRPVTCLNCVKAPPPFTSSMAVFEYNDIIKHLLLQFKYGDKTNLKILFAKWLFNRISDNLADIDYITPVPLHFFRLVNRRYNQAQLIINEMKHRHFCPDIQQKCIPDILQRIKHTKPMGHLSPRERKNNIRGSIRLNKKWISEIKAKKILLIDDVFTTGATFTESTKILKKHGADEVHVACIARVPHRR